MSGKLKFVTKLFQLSLLFFITFNSIYALEVPFLSGRIIDEVGILDSATRISIEKQLEEHEKTTSNQIVILIIPTLEGEILEEYSLKVASTWKLGQKGKDNGVLLLIAKDDRKLRIEVGYGLEGSLTDVLCNRIIRNEITPSFKQGDFSKGIEKGINSIVDAIKGNYSIPEDGSTEEYSEIHSEMVDQIGESDIPLFLRVIFGGMFVLVITPFTFAAAFTPYIGWFLYFFLMPFYATFPVVALGKAGKFAFPTYAVLMLFIKIYFGFTNDGKKLAKKYGKYFEGSGSSGGSRSGWSSGGGGGFSGGGGSFGGGGSSGSW